VTRAFVKALEQRLSDIQSHVLTWSNDDLKKHQGYIQALLDMNPQEFSVEDFK